MTSTIEVRHEEVGAALVRIQERLDDMKPVLQGIGEDIVARTKRRFATATAPDGTAWRPNTAATIINYIASRGGLSKKTGKINAKGQALAISKKPLQGASGDLARQIFYSADATSVTAGSSMIYAAMQHFGGAKSNFPDLWGDIPARAILPVTAAGELYQGEADAILSMLQDYLQDGLAI
ncbi:phage virion morphogenesis protein [Massilia sp. NR 4-1]|uniref:phage virion morphogenesis protein n=1 Tax=Massilia sp. NR 4-1 TaxID=1678028 RepID=UPI00067D44E7|nr:phage virion morphogenesis protein [Massilia sp. NR 4-1]